jgi:hypothetical protein
MRRVERIERIMTACLLHPVEPTFNPSDSDLEHAYRFADSVVSYVERKAAEDWQRRREEEQARLEREGPPTVRP